MDFVLGKLDGKFGFEGQGFSDICCRMKILEITEFIFLKQNQSICWKSFDRNFRFFQRNQAKWKLQSGLLTELFFPKIGFVIAIQLKFMKFLTFPTKNFTLSLNSTKKERNLEPPKKFQKNSTFLNVSIVQKLQTKKLFQMNFPS